MPRMRQVSIGICTLLAVLASSGRSDAVPGCPFCAPSAPPFSQRLAECDVALEVKWVSLESDEKLQKARTTFEVVKPFRVSDRAYKAKDRVVLDFDRSGEPGDLFLLIGTDGKESVNWEQPVSLSSEYLYAYIRRVPPPEAPDRLAFFLKFLEFPDAEIGADAYGEFSRAKYKEVAALAPRMPRAKLREWLASTDPHIQVRLGLYGMMLGLSGDDSDAEFLEQLIMKSPEPDKPRFGIDGMMAGYVLIRGKAGLEKLTAAKFADPNGEDDLLALQNAVMFLWEYAQDRVPPDAIRATMRRNLDRPKIATAVIENLARWKDWESLDRLVQNYGKEPFDSNLSRQKIVKFALVCERDGKKTNPEALPPSAIKARKFLNSLDRDFVESVERGFIRETR